MKAHAAVGEARQIAGLPLPHVAARQAYIAVFHAAEAIIFERTGKVARTHTGVRSEFARLAKAESRIGRDLTTFLAAAYQFKQQADYGIGSVSISIEEATTAIGTAQRFVDCVAELCQQGSADGAPNEEHDSLKRGAARGGDAR